MTATVFCTRWWRHVRKSILHRQTARGCRVRSLRRLKQKAMTLVSLDSKTNATGSVKKPLYVHCKLQQTNWNTVNLIVLLLAALWNSSGNMGCYIRTTATRGTNDRCTTGSQLTHYGLEMKYIRFNFSVRLWQIKCVSRYKYLSIYLV